MNRQEVERVLESQNTFKSYLEEGGEAGMALGLVNDIFKLDGEDTTDRECLDLIEKTILYFRESEREGAKE